MAHPLRTLRDALGLTQDEMAADLDISGLDGDKISKIERKIRDLSRREGIRLIDVYGERARDAAEFVSAGALVGSEVAYPGPDEACPHAPTLAMLLYPQGKAATMIVNARSMVLEGYMPGCRILVDLDRQPRLGDAVVVRVDDGPTGGANMLRLYKPPDLLAAALEQDFRPFREDDERIKIMAVVVARYRKAAVEPRARKSKRAA